MKNIAVFTLFILLLASCGKDLPSSDVCANQSMDFQSCLSCCEDNGFSGASLPTDASGNTTECECVE